ncbi:unnamed protein product [Mortierella alpina]
MVGMHPPPQQPKRPTSTSASSSSAPHPHAHIHATDPSRAADTSPTEQHPAHAPALDTRIAVEDRAGHDYSSPRQQSYSHLKPGLHGRARIRGSSRTVRMVLLTTALMGLQFTWSVEMAYGTPFLLQLGLSKSLMSLVWLAGPLSGLVMQPVVGILSDRCTSKLGRRRPFLIVGVTAVVVSFLCLGWCKEIMTAAFGTGYANLEGATILMAVGSIYILDFAINCVQASCRTLIVDSLPSSQQEEAASWASRLMGLGGIFGYFMGNVDLPQLLPFFGDTQIKCLCVLACLFLALTVGLTCFAVTERVMVRSPRSSSSSSLKESLQGFTSVLRAIRYLPTRIQQLCNVQFFAWMGWFPFLFYSSTYIAEIYTQEQARIEAPVDPDQDPVTSGVGDAAVRAGSFCLLIYSIVSLASSIILPAFVAPAEHLTTEHTAGPFSYTSQAPHGSDGVSLKRQSSPRRCCWKRPSRTCLPWWLSLPIPGLTLPKMYTLSLGLVSFSLVSTWYIQDIKGSTVLFACCGVAWAVSMWAPFSILGEVISQQMQEEQHQERLLSLSTAVVGENVDVIYQKADEQDDDDDVEDIRMADASMGRFSRSQQRYQPVGVRESLDGLVSPSTDPNTTGDPKAGTFRSRGATPSPPTTSSQAPSAWDAPVKNTKEMAHVDTDSDQDLVSSSASASSSSGGSEGDRLRRSRRQDRRSSSRPTTPGISSPAGPGSEAASAGALLGIHNIYIVLPQFLVSFLSSLVFAAIEPDVQQQGDTQLVSEQAGDPDTIGVMLRFGGVMAGIAALLSIRLWQQPRSVVAVSQAHHL